MSEWLKSGLIWLVISICLGAAASYFFNVRFLDAVVIAAMALTVNGLIATWEDRGKFND